MWPPPAAISSASRQRVVIKGSDVWYRVGVGPFNDLKRLQGARQRRRVTSTTCWSRSNPGEGAG
ncbi:MAG: hypothetical protein M3461_07610 [Pseudomonadota bacterium]|nr:hypothetical protein [Pseudomonadota bacterium]